MRPGKWLVSMLGAVLLTGMAARPAHAAAVGLELMLLVDVSGSVDATEYNLQKAGYVQAFQDAAVQAAIIGSQGGAIAVTYVEWSGVNQQSQQVGWTLINDATSANAFAAAINGTSRAFSGQTGIQAAMGKEYVLFGTEVGAAGNGFESTRQVIDVSGDGADNDSSGFCNTVACGRNIALAAGVDVINGLPILGEAGLLNYYQTQVQGGAGSFTTAADSFDDFGNAVKSKLVREISNTPVPEPASLSLLGLGLAAARAARRRKTAQK